MAGTTIQKTKIPAGGMTCGHCVNTVEQALLGVDGVHAASADLESQSATIEYDAAATDIAAMQSAVAAVGYGPRESGGLVTLEPAASAPPSDPRDEASADPAAAPGTEEFVARVDGMTCASCVRSVEEAALQVVGVQACNVNLTEATARVVLEPGANRVEDVLQAISAVGYKATLERDRSAEGEFDEDPSGLVRRLAVAATLTVPLLVLAMSHGRLDFPGSRWVQFGLALPVLVYGGTPIFKAAWTAALHFRSDMNTLIAVGTGTSFLYSVVALLAPLGAARGGSMPVYFETAAAILTLVLLGRHLESKARRKTSASIRKLLALQPATVRVRRDGAETEVPLASVRVGDEVLIRPGERIPVDGTVVSGAGAVDESPISGESVPADKEPGSAVVSGSLNLDGFLAFRAESVGSETALSRIIEFVRRAQGSKAPAARMADKIAAVFVPIILAIALVTFLAWALLSPSEDSLRMAVNSAVSVLIIACPCALGLATPAALAVGIGRAAEKGILIRDGNALEAARNVDTAVFDKTGTLTLGQFAVTDIETCGEMTAATLVSKASAIEALSEHPIAKAIAERGTDGGDAVTDYRALPGAGASARIDGEGWLLGKRDLIAGRGIDISAAESVLERLADEGKSVVLAARNGILEGVFGLRDTIRPEAPEAAATLRSLGLRTHVLSGDSARATRAVATEAGIDEVLAPVMPIEKSGAIAKLQAHGRVVAMVGDGINDAPALTQADLGFAIGSGTDIAVESAGIVLVRNDPRDVGRAIQLASRTQRAIVQNYCWAFGYNLLGVPVAAGALFPWTGLLLSPIIASAAMALSSLSVLSNSLRLRHALGKD